MATKDLENKVGNKLFKNPILNLLHFTNPPLILGTYLPIIIGVFGYGFYQGYVSSIWVALGIFVFAFFFWTLFEYLVHRHVFHLFEDNPSYHRIYQVLHGFHHDYPKDPNHLFMPPIAGVGASILVFGILYLILGKYAFFFMPGFLLGYLAYVMTHYAMHRYQPPFKWLEPVWKHHHLHHFRYPDHAFGVSSPFWDRVFGTLPPRPPKKK